MHLASEIQNLAQIFPMHSVLLDSPVDDVRQDILLGLQMLQGKTISTSHPEHDDYGQGIDLSCIGAEDGDDAGDPGGFVDHVHFVSASAGHR